MFENIEFPEPLWKRIILFFIPTQTRISREVDSEGEFKVVVKLKVFRNQIYIRGITRYEVFRNTKRGYE